MHSRTAPLQSYFCSAFRFFAASASAALLTFATASAALAQQTAATNPARLTQAVDGSVLTTLKGNVHPLANARNDKGLADASLPAERMQLVLKPSAEQEFALRQTLSSLQDKNSPQYRKWLTPEQFGARYGVNDADIQTVENWLTAEGFKVGSVNKAHTVIEFSGSVGQIQTAFHTQIHNFQVNGESHLANISDPKIPSALTPVVAGLASLNNFFPRTQHTKPQLGRYDKASGRLVPQLTLGSGTTAEPYTLYLVPGDAATIYDTPNDFNIKYTGTTPYTGNGVTVAIAGDSNIATSDVTEYRNLFGMSATAPSVVIDGNDPGVNGDVVEALLDLEISGALAPDATQILYTSANTNFQGGVFLAISRALNDNAADILNVSFGECEAYQGQSGNEFINGLWEQAAAQGISVTVSSDDSGSAGCDDDNSQFQASQGLQVNGIASTPFNIAVGGTDFDVLGTTSGFVQYVSLTNSNTFESALGFIPEEPWNNSTAANGLLSANTPLLDSNGDGNIVGTGGGASGCLNADLDANGNVLGCLAAAAGSSLTGYAKPSWQTGGTINVPADGVRDLPDVSLFSANGQYGAAWLVCYTFTASDGTPVTCAPNSSGEFNFIAVGGTSSSSPAFAGILALISQSQGGRLGQANYVLYNLANQGALYNSTFHDVTTGNNSVYCVAGSTNCGTNDFLTGYDAGTAYDQASGLGSVNVSQLISNWANAAFIPTTTTFTINGSTVPVSITHGQAVALSASVAGAGGTPTGDVSLITGANEQAGGTYNSNGLGYLNLNAGTTGSVSYTNLPGGTYTVSAYYGGDIEFSQSEATPGVQVTVGKENSVLTLGLNGLSSGQVSPFPYGTAFSVDGQPIGVSQQNAPTGTSLALATGTVTFTDAAGPLPGSTSTSAAGAVQIASNGFAELPLYYWSPAAHSVTASYGGDNSFNASSATTPVAFTVTAAPTASTVTSSAATVSTGTFTVTSLITPNPASGATSPTGTVTLTIGGTAIGSGAVTATQSSTTGASLGTATVTVNVSSLAAGANTITAAYSGDANYTASSGTVVVSSTTTPTTGTFAIAGTAVTVAPGATTGNTSTVTVTPANGFTGVVNLTAALTTSPAGVVDPPTIALAASSVTISGTTAATTTATISSTAASTSMLKSPQMNRWYTAAGGAALACVLFFGIPARRRGWRSMLTLLIFLAAMGGMGCGGGSGNTTPTNPGTTAGAYVFTVTGTDAATGKIVETGTIALTVN